MCHVLQLIITREWVSQNKACTINACMLINFLQHLDLVMLRVGTCWATWYKLEWFMFLRKTLAFLKPKMIMRMKAWAVYIN